MKDAIEFNKTDPETRLPKILYHHLHSRKLELDEVKRLSKADDELTEDYYVVYECKDLSRFFKESVSSLQLHLEDNDEKAFITVISPHERTAYTDFSINLYGSRWFLYKDEEEEE